ncbi:hypothetical protein MBLNU230_g2616t1 [Neophaeotheca triangularis]
MATQSSDLVTSISPKISLGTITSQGKRAALDRLAPELLDQIFENLAPITTQRTISHGIQELDAPIFYNTKTSYQWPATSTTKHRKRKRRTTRTSKPLPKTSSPHQTWLPLRLTNRALDTHFRSWYHGGGPFTFTSAERTYTSTDNRAPYNSAGRLVNWLDSTGAQNLHLITRLHLRMFASELLMLFAPPEARRLLNLHRAVPAGGLWERASEGLRGLRLNELVVEVAAGSCPEPCRASCVSNRRKGGRLGPDLEWVLKALGEAFAFTEVRRLVVEGSEARVVDMDRLGVLSGVSWEAMVSRTVAFHRCDALWENEQRWRQPDDGRAEYRVPMGRLYHEGHGKDWVDELEAGIGSLWGEL